MQGSHYPVEITALPTVDPARPDDALILAASWEERCLGSARILGRYSCSQIFMAVYDGPSELRRTHISELHQRLSRVAQITQIDVNRANPLPAVRRVIGLVRDLGQSDIPRLSIDISTFTRKHLLQLLQGLDLEGLLASSQFVYTEPSDYPTQDDEPLGSGVSSVKAIETFGGQNTPSRDSLLLLFLGYEGRRTQALWEHLEPNITLAIVPDPPTRDSWRGRTEAQNRYLLSCIPRERVLKSHALVPSATEALLSEVISSDAYRADRYNYLVAPLGTKAQILGLYRFWRNNRGFATVMYARPLKYREEHASFPPRRTWVLDRSDTWL
jgi:hypothetical protein